MLQRTKQTLALTLMVPLVASVGISAASTSSTAAISYQQSYNGSFDAGRTGWYFGTSRTRVSIVDRGVGGGKAMKLVNRRTGQVVFAGRHMRSAGADLTYSVSGWVRGNQPGLRGRMVLKETRGTSAKYTVKRFTVGHAWTKVSMPATTRSGASKLQLRVGLDRLYRGKSE